MKEKKITEQPHEELPLLPVESTLAEYNVGNVDQMLDVVRQHFGEHFATHAQKLIVENVRQQTFPDVTKAVATFALMEAAAANSETPTATFCAICAELHTLGYTELQARTLLAYLCDYIRPATTEFADWKHQAYMYDLLRSYLHTDDELANGKAREKLKRAIAAELDNLPELLEALDADKRIAVELKLLPYLTEKDKEIRLW